MNAKETNFLYVTNRIDWRQWLTEHYATAVEIWLVYPRKQSGLPRIPYNDAVEEALCFGWIDSITKGVDRDRFAQRFTPRKKGNSISQTNKERLRRLIEQGKVLPEIETAVQPVLNEPFVFPADIKTALQADEQVWQNFQSYSEAYQRIRVAYVETARQRGAEFDKRLKNLLNKTSQNKQFGFGIKSYY